MLMCGAPVGTRCVPHSEGVSSPAFAGASAASASAFASLDELVSLDTSCSRLCFLATLTRAGNVDAARISIFGTPARMSASVSLACSAIRASTIRCQPFSAREQPRPVKQVMR